MDAKEMMKKRQEAWTVLKERGALRGDHYLMNLDQLNEALEKTKDMKVVNPRKERKVSVKVPVKKTEPKKAEPKKDGIREIAMKDPACQALQKELEAATTDEQRTEIRARFHVRVAELKKEHGIA